VAFPSSLERCGRYPPHHHGSPELPDHRIPWLPAPAKRRHWPWSTRTLAQRGPLSLACTDARTQRG